MMGWIPDTCLIRVLRSRQALATRRGTLDQLTMRDLIHFDLAETMADNLS
jgi:hypothetical protein